MHVSEESHSGVLPMNHSNKDGKPLAGSAEERPLIKENARQPNMGVVYGDGKSGVHPWTETQS
jgi:hypothetical protein